MHVAQNKTNLSAIPNANAPSLSLGKSFCARCVAKLIPSKRLLSITLFCLSLLAMISAFDFYLCVSSTWEDNVQLCKLQSSSTFDQCQSKLNALQNECFQLWETIKNFHI